MGYSVGTSLLEGDKVAFARQMLEQAGQNHVMLLLPVDTVAADHFAADAESKIVDIKAIPDGWMGMLELMDLAKPKEMTGKSLIIH